MVSNDSSVKPIGGYFELECAHFPTHLGGIYVNSGSNALRLVVRKLKISRIHVPYYTCPVVHRALESEGCEILPYGLDCNFLPSCSFPKDDFILVNDYFGVTGENVRRLAAEYPNVIADNAQSYFADPVGRAAVYSPRKFFGLPDGGIAVFCRDEVDASDLEPDESYDRMAHLLKRHDLGASAAYADFKQNDSMLFSRPIMAISRLTRALMGNIDEAAVRSRRLANFAYLNNRLGTSFPLNPLAGSVPLVFPYVSHDPTLRHKLIEAQIFVATYWPGCEHSDHFVETILPIPIDQRYGEEDMNRIVEVVRG